MLAHEPGRLVSQAAFDGDICNTRLVTPTKNKCRERRHRTHQRRGKASRVGINCRFVSIVRPPGRGAAAGSVVRASKSEASEVDRRRGVTRSPIGVRRGRRDVEDALSLVFSRQDFKQWVCYVSCLGAIADTAS